MSGIFLEFLAAASNFSFFETFTTSDTWTVPSYVTSIEVFMVAGGAGGGGTASASGDGAGGGGSGAGVYYRSFTVTPGAMISFTIGAGGSGGTQDLGANGSDTTFGTLTAYGGGGGGGGGAPAQEAGQNGGSGGGACGNGGVFAGGNVGTHSGVPVQGANFGGSAGRLAAGGGGGGISTIGVATPDFPGPDVPGDGGAGVSLTFLGNAFSIGGGGGGGQGDGGTAGTAVNGGGSGGAALNDFGNNGSANTGGGGGGSARSASGSTGGNGGSGVIYIAYGDIATPNYPYQYSFQYLKSHGEGPSYPSDATSELLFNTDGTISYTTIGTPVDGPNTHATDTINWYNGAPSGGIGSSYWIYPQLVSGTLTGGTTDTWLQLSSAHGWTITQTASAIQGIMIKQAQLCILISTSSGGPTIGVVQAYLRAEAVGGA